MLVKAGIYRADVCIDDFMQRLLYLQNSIVQFKSAKSILLTFLYSFHLPRETDTHTVYYHFYYDTKI